MDAELGTEPGGEPAGEVILRRMLASARVSGDSDDAPPTARSLGESARLAFGRALRVCDNLPFSVADLTESRMPLCEVLERLESGMFLAVLENGAAGPGLIILDADIATAVVDFQTLGQIPPALPESRRKPTRTDSALVAPLVDQMLTELDAMPAPDSGWATGYRFASFMDDPRPIGLILDDCDYIVLQTHLAAIPPRSAALAGHAPVQPEAERARTGAFLLALPVTPIADPVAANIAPHDGEEPMPDGQPTAAPADSGIAQAMRSALQAYPVTLNAILARVPMALGAATTLKPGDMLEVSVCALEQVRIEGLDGLPIATARLGQARGNRAVRVTSDQPARDDPKFLSAALSQTQPGTGKLPTAPAITSAHPEAVGPTPSSTPDQSPPNGVR